ncbi:MAG: Ribonuclease P protein component [Chlamydiae bacterium]|nr:Ribonuclease P protein component [Chlamydiota bacterium]
MRISQENVHRRRAQSDQSPPPQGTQILKRLIFPKSARILRRAHFKAISKGRNRFFGSVLIIDYCPGRQPRLGITASRQFGNAVRRNHFKRLVREAFRLNQHELAPFEIVVFPRKGIENFNLEMISSDLLKFSNAQLSATKRR